MREMLLSLAAQDGTAPACRRILSALPCSLRGSEPRGAQSAIINRHSTIVEPLTPRELDILVLLRERLSNKEIAQQQCLSTATVKRHLVNINGKLGVDKCMQAVTRAETLGLLPRR